MHNFQNFFILGNPRSGTSLLRIILNSHSEIVVPPESGFLVWWYKKYKNIDSEFKNIEQYVDDILSSKKIETWNVEKNTLINLIEKNNPNSYAQFSNIVYLSYANRLNKNPKIIGDKNNYYIGYTNEIINIYKQAKFIQIIRDPRDVACSYLALEKLNSSSEYKPNLPLNANDIAEEWNNNNNKILNFFSQIPKDKYISIRYEDLILEPKSTLSLLCQFLNINFEENMLSYYIDNQQNGIEPSQTIEWKKKTLEPLDANNIGKYKNKLDSSQTSTINNITLELRNKYGYE